MLVYKSLHGLAPLYLSDDCQLVTDVGRRHLRSSDVYTCFVPQTQSQIGDRSFSVAGPRQWNNLPTEIRNLTQSRHELSLSSIHDSWNFLDRLLFKEMYSYLLIYLLTYSVLWTRNSTVYARLLIDLKCKQNTTFWAIWSSSEYHFSLTLAVFGVSAFNVFGSFYLLTVVSFFKTFIVVV